MPEETKPSHKILYHYTPFDNFKKIVASRRIHATRYDQMNDFSEVELGVKNLLHAVKNFETDDQKFMEFLIQGIESFQQAPLGVYIFSFSEIQDSLDQWRAYTRSGGVAIGFNYEKVKRGFLCDITRKLNGQKTENPNQPDPSNPLIQCIYTDQDGYLDLQSVVKRRFFQPDSYAAMFAAKNHVAQAVLYAALPVAIYQTICSIKHGAYAFEKEWRWVNFRKNEDDYPVMLSDTNRFYVEAEFDPKDYIDEIWISPHGDRIAYERVISYLMKQHGLRYTIKDSKIPFRTG